MNIIDDTKNVDDLSKLCNKIFILGNKKIQEKILIPKTKFKITRHNFEEYISPIDYELYLYAKKIQMQI